MASLNRGQPPAWHTKVVHQGPGCLKAGSKGEPTVVVMLCPQSLLMTDVVQSEVTSCGNKPCTHIVIGSTFRSNINGRVYSILDCSSKNVIYLISCGKCGIQYVGKTSQKL